MCVGPVDEMMRKSGDSSSEIVKYCRDEANEGDNAALSVNVVITPADLSDTLTTDFTRSHESMSEVTEVTSASQKSMKRVLSTSPITPNEPSPYQLDLDAVRCAVIKLPETTFDTHPSCVFLQAAEVARYKMDARKTSEQSLSLTQSRLTTQEEAEDSDEVLQLSSRTCSTQAAHTKHISPISSPVRLQKQQALSEELFLNLQSPLAQRIHDRNKAASAPLAALNSTANTVPSSILMRTGEVGAIAPPSPYALSTLVASGMTGNNIGSGAYPDDVSEGNPSIAESQATTVNNGMLGSPFSDNTSLASLQSHTSQYITQNTPNFNPRSGGQVQQQQQHFSFCRVPQPALASPSVHKHPLALAKNNPFLRSGSGTVSASIGVGKASGGLTIDVFEEMEGTHKEQQRNNGPQYHHKSYNTNATAGINNIPKAVIPVSVEENMRGKHIEVNKSVSQSSFSTDRNNSAKYSTSSSKFESDMDSENLFVHPGKRMTLVRRMKKTGSAVLRATRLMKPKVIHEEEDYSPPAHKLSPNSQRKWECENINLE